MRDASIAKNYADALLTLATRAQDAEGWGALVSALGDAVAQDVPAPRNTPFWAAHCVWVSWWQVIPLAVAMQQAPVMVVVGQMPAVEQSVPLPR